MLASLQAITKGFSVGSASLVLRQKHGKHYFLKTRTWQETLSNMETRLQVPLCLCKVWRSGLMCLGRCPYVLAYSSDIFPPHCLIRQRSEP